MARGHDGRGVVSLRAPLPSDAGPRLARALDDAWQALGDDDGVPRALWDAALIEPLAEFTRRPGKELRAILCEVGWALGDGDGPLPDAVPLVVDALHAGSLIIDDIEDRAVERRGAPALHLLHGDATALNAGNWLYFWALAQIGEIGGSAERQLAMHRRVIATLVSCHEGQALDLRARVDRLETARLAPVCAAITRGKTACLAALAMELGALAAGATVECATEIGALGAAVGTALQMLDDLGSLGVERRNKGHEDLRARRVTWPWAWLPDITHPLAVARLQARIRGAVTDDELDELADDLRGLVLATGRRRIRATIEEGLARAQAAHGDRAALRGVAAMVARMEESYG